MRRPVVRAVVVSAVVGALCVLGGYSAAAEAAAGNWWPLWTLSACALVAGFIAAAWRAELRRHVEPAVEPTRPRGVWAEYADGETYHNLILVPDGVDDQGYALFRVILPRDPDQDAPVRFGAAKWPPRTAITLYLSPYRGPDG